MPHHPVAILDPDRPAPGWMQRLPTVHALHGPDPPLADLRGALQGAACALVDGSTPSAIELARRIREAEPAVQIAIVAAPEARTRLRRDVMFEPGLGEVWVIPSEEVGPAFVERAGHVTRQRRAYRGTRTHLQHDLARIEPYAARRAVISDAYLAALLGVLPHPVVSVDEDGRILSWSAAAERVLGHARGDVLGEDLARVLAPDDPARVERLLAAAGADRPREVRFRRKDGAPGVAAMTVVPIEAIDLPVRAVFLQDLTEERRVRGELERKAGELEMQAEALRASQLDLERANAELARTNRDLAARQREADRARERAEESRREAEAANRAKSDFLATMSHEIRTPINAIIGYTDLLEMGVRGPVSEGQKAHLRRIKTSSRHLLDLVDDVLDLAKIEAGRLSFEPERSMAADAIEAALALVRPLAEQRGISISHRRLENDDVSYVGDEDRVRQILVNLLSNAIKFTRPGGRIRILYGTENPHSEMPAEDPWSFIHVEDTGIGIPPDELDRIFEAFEQVSSGTTRTQGGTGLGLTISRRLARLMGGDLTVRSEADHGSVFSLWLPSETTILAPLDEAVLAELLYGRPLPAGLAAAGQALQEQGREIVERYLARLLADERIPLAPGIGQADLEDHAPSLVADLAQTLIALERGRAVPERLLRDSGEIQRVIAELHGGQRAQIGWAREALEADLLLLRSELEATVRGQAAADDPEEVLAVLHRFLERVERISLLAWQRASHARSAVSSRVRSFPASTAPGSGTGGPDRPGDPAARGGPGGSAGRADDPVLEGPDCDGR